MVSMVKAHGRHAQCDTWEEGAHRCRHPRGCDRVVLIDPVGERVFMGADDRERGLIVAHVPTDRTEYARHAA